jgi:hypothetical protein
MACIDAQPLMKMRRGLTVQPADTRDAANNKSIITKIFLFAEIMIYLLFIGIEQNTH